MTTLVVSNSNFDFIKRWQRFIGVFRSTLDHVNWIQSRNKKKFPTDETLHQAMKTWSHQIFKLLDLEIKIIGAGPQETKCIFVGNHLSYVDIPMLMKLTPTTFVAKQELSHWPVIRHAVRAGRVVLVNRQTPNSRVLVTQKIHHTLFQDNLNITVFPSGTTSLGETRPWRVGIFKAAQELGVPIQPFRLSYQPMRPVAYVGRDFFPLHLWRLLKYRKILAHIEFHPPVPVVNPEDDCLKWWRWTQNWHPTEI